MQTPHPDLHISIEMCAHFKVIKPKLRFNLLIFDNRMFIVEIFNLFYMTIKIIVIII